MNADRHDQGQLNGEEGVVGNLKKHVLSSPLSRASLDATVSELLVSMTTPFLGDNFTG